MAEILIYKNENKHNAELQRRTNLGTKVTGEFSAQNGFL